MPCASLWVVPCTPLFLKTLILWDLIGRIQKRMYLGCTFGMGFGWSPCALLSMMSVFWISVVFVPWPLLRSVFWAYLCGVGGPRIQKRIHRGGACHIGFGRRPRTLLLSMGGALVLHCRCPLAAPAFHHLCVLVGGLQLLLGIMGYLHSPPLLLLGIVGDLHSPPLPIGNGSREIFISAAHFGGFCFFCHSSISHSWFQDVSPLGATPLPLTFVEAPTVTLHPSLLGSSWDVLGGVAFPPLSLLGLVLQRLLLHCPHLVCNSYGACVSSSPGSCGRGCVVLENLENIFHQNYFCVDYIVGVVCWIIICEEKSNKFPGNPSVTGRNTLISVPLTNHRT